MIQSKRSARIADKPKFNGDDGGECKICLDPVIGNRGNLEKEIDIQF